MTKAVRKTIDGLPIKFFHGLPCVESEVAYAKHPKLGEWMTGQTGLGPIDGKCYIYLWDYDRFLSGRKVID